MAEKSEICNPSLITLLPECRPDNLLNFFEELDFYSKFANWPESLLADIVKLKASPQVKLVLESSEDWVKIRDVKIIKAKLEEHFIESDCILDSLRKFLSLKQFKEESVKDFALRVESLAYKKLYTEFGKKGDFKELYDHLLVSKFVEGLEHDIKFQVFIRSPTTFELAKSIAERIEKVTKIHDEVVNSSLVEEKLSFKVLMEKALNQAEKIQELKNSIAEVRQEKDEVVESRVVKRKRGGKRYNKYRPVIENLDPLVCNYVELDSRGCYQNENKKWGKVKDNWGTRNNSKWRACVNSERIGRRKEPSRSDTPYVGANSTGKCKNDKLPIITTSILGKNFNVLCDSGATKSIITLDVARFLKLKIDSCVDRSLSALTGIPIKLVGQAYLKLPLGGRVYNVNCLVVNQSLSSSFQILLGSNFFTRYKFKIDFKKSVLNNDDICIKWSGYSSHNDLNFQSETHTDLECIEKIFGTLDKKVRIPPHSEKIFHVSLRSNEGGVNCKQVIVSQNEDLNPDGYLVAASLSKIENNKCLVQVMNLKDEEIVVNKHTKLVTVEPYKFGVSFADSVNNAQIGLESDFEAFGGEIDLNHLNRDQRREMTLLLKKFKNIFAKDLKGLGCCDLITHNIRLTDDTPVRQKPYRVPHHLQPEMKRQVTELLEAGIIEPSTTPYAAPVLLVKKHDGSYRLVSDLRKLNEKTLPDNFPLPNMAEMLDMLGGAKFFSTLDLTSGFHQMKMSEEDAHKTGIVVPNMGSFQYKRLPFGLKNASSSFQRLMSLILAGLSPLSIAVYIDDIVVASKTFDEHMERLKIVFERLEKHNLKLKPKKCSLAKNEISFLGHKIKDGKVLPETKNLEAVLNFKTPSTRKQVRAFLGLTGFYRKFIPNYAETALPLTNLTKTDRKFTWNDEAERAYKSLKTALVSEPCLKLPDFSRPFALATDASAYALGCVLLQEDEEGDQHPVACASRKLSQPELNYSVYEKEALGVIFGINYFKHYLIGTKFTVYCDQKSLQYILNLKSASPRITRWILSLQEYDYKIIHKPGKLNLFADHLSREVEDPETPVSNAVQVESKFNSIPIDEIVKRQKNDEFCKSVLDILKTNSNYDHPKFDFYISEENVLMCNMKVKKRNMYFSRQPKLVVPHSLKSEVLLLCHDNACATHPGLNRTLSKIKKSFYWQGYYADVKNYVASCHDCLAKRGFKPNLKAPLQHVPITSRPFEKVAIDAVGPLVTSRKGNKWILVLSDYFTRWPEAYPVPDIKSNTVAEVLIDFISRHGVMESLHSDRGSNFVSEVIQEVCNILGIKKTNTLAYNPQANGVLEKLNKTLVSSLSYLVSKNQEDWCEKIPLALFAHRTNCHSALQDSPAFVLYGRDLRTPVDLLASGVVRSYSDTPSYAKQLAANLKIIYEEVKQNLESVAKNQEKRSEGTNKCKKVEVGDRVYLHSEVIPVGVSKKLVKPNIGPYRVVLQKSPVVFDIAPVNDPNKVQSVHINRLITFPERKDLGMSDTLVVFENKKRDDLVRKEIMRGNKQFDFPLAIPTPSLHPIWDFSPLLERQNKSPSTSENVDSQNINVNDSDNMDLSSDNIEVIEELDIGANEEVQTSSKNTRRSQKAKSEIISDYNLRKRDPHGFVSYRK